MLRIQNVLSGLILLSPTWIQITGFPSLNILDEQVISHRRVGELVPIQLVFVNEDDHQQARNLPMHLCLTVNGKECICSDDFLELGIHLDPKCTLDTAHWFAVTLTEQRPAKGDVENSIISTAQAVASYPIRIHASADSSTNEAVNTDDTITMVLPLTLDDLSRSAVLFTSLRLTGPGVIQEVIVIVPDHQYAVLDAALMGFHKMLPFPVRVLKESILFRRKQQPQAVPYAVQMATKLLAARIVTTEFYLTLDADVVLLRPFCFADLIHVTYTDDGRRRARALYEHEGRFLYHPHWWEGSEQLLGMSSKHPLNQGFGVTPALMSTFGSLLTVGAVEAALADRWRHRTPRNSSQCAATAETAVRVGGDGGDGESQVPCRDDVDDNNVDGSEAAEAMWLDQFSQHGQIWSEYTLYRVALDHFQIFDELHVAQVQDSKLEERRALSGADDGSPCTMDGSQESEQKRLHCFNVWYAEQLPWQAARALRPECNCLFSVVQSSTGVSPGLILVQWTAHVNITAVG